MSATDIYPPQVYNVSLPYHYSFRSATSPSHWGAWTNVESMNSDVTSGISRRGQVTYRYQVATETGELTENPFTFTRTLDRHTRGHYSYLTKGNADGWFASELISSGTFGDAMFPAPSYVTISSLRKLNLDNEVKQKVFAKVKDQSVNLAVAYAERKETMHTIASALSRLGKGFNLAKAGKFVEAAIALTGHKPRGAIRDTVSGNWLELQYGWLPLMSDIFGAVETLHKQMHSHKYVVVKSRKKIQEVIPTKVISGSDGEFVDYTLASALYESSVRVKMRSNSTSLAKASELGLTNPLFVAWERVPLSFVVDWALPIGSFLNQFDSALGWEFAGGSITTFDVQKSDKSRSVGKVPSSYVRLSCELNRFVESVTCVRTPIIGWVDMMTIPYIKDPTSLTHIANAWALLTQRR